MSTSDQSLQRVVDHCKERGIILPTYRQLADPNLIPAGIRNALMSIGRNELNPLNLFRISWKNEPRLANPGFGSVNYLELPRELTGVEARIFILLGRYFPTGAHKVGATFGPLVEKLLSGQFDPTRQKALWPSTGNYCRGGAFNGALLGCSSIAVLPEEMSRERFDWLKSIGSEVIKTPGGESNVREIYEKVKQLVRERGAEIVVLNQFEEFGNPRWHYAVTGPAMEEVFQLEKQAGQRLSGLFLTQGSAGTLGSGDFLRTIHPTIKIGAGEALQCPTLLYNGHGAHRIEGIGDKHVPWILNACNLDLVAGINDADVMNVMRLFNEPNGLEYLKQKGVGKNVADQLSDFGISSIANILGAIKMARYYEFSSSDIILTVATDSMDMYKSRLKSARENIGSYDKVRAAVDDAGLMNTTTDHMQELGHYDKKRIHNLKYFTWVEQQGKCPEELDVQWKDVDHWQNQLDQAEIWDQRIMEFNDRTGLLKRYQ